MPRNALLLSQARSGSTAAVGLLNANGQAFVSEPLVFAVEGPLRLRTYLEAKQVGAAEFARNPMAVFRRYLAWLRTEVGASHIGLDIKLSYLAQLNGASWCLDTPKVLQWAIDNDYLILHLIRRNRFEQFVSTERALKGGIWHLDQDGNEVRVSGGKEVRIKPSGEPAQITIDPVACERFMVEVEHRTEAVRNWCASVQAYREIFYEDIFDDAGALRGDAKRELEDLFSIMITNDGAPLRKIGSARYVENSDAVLKHFAGTRFEPWVTAALT